jgi:hypothetical protein
MVREAEQRACRPMAVGLRTGNSDPAEGVVTQVAFSPRARRGRHRAGFGWRQLCQPSSIVQASG